VHTGPVLRRALDQPISCPHVMDILVYSGLELLGDGVMKLPFVHALRRAWPEAHVTWLAGKGKTVYSSVLAPLVGDCLDEIIEDAGIGSAASELLRNPLPGRRFDLVIDTQRRVLTTLILRRIRTRCFISGAARYLFSTRRPRTRRAKPPSVLGQLMALLELARGERVEPVFDVTLPPEWVDRAALLLPPGPCYVGLAPGAGHPIGGATKRWPLERFIALARAQAAAGRRPVFLLGPAEVEWLGELRAAVPQALFPLQEDANGNGAELSPLLTIAVARNLSVAVANDSGTAHLLGAAGCPIVSLFGPTRAEKSAPATRRLEVIDAKSFGEPVMASIPVQPVADAVERLLRAERGR
jgi:ADP-heptose:LPS heptosyltransferase